MCQSGHFFAERDPLFSIPDVCKAEVPRMRIVVDRFHYCVSCRRGAVFSVLSRLDPGSPASSDDVERPRSGRRLTTVVSRRSSFCLPCGHTQAQHALHSP